MNDSLPAIPGTPSSGRRRRLMYAGVAGAAVLAGGGLAVWESGQHGAQQHAGDHALQEFWALNFDTPAGPSLPMQSFQGRPLLINFWATWCPPCVEELPLLDAFYRQQAPKSWQVLGLAIDQPSAVRNFLAKTPVSFPVGLAGLDGTELGKALGNLSGSLPFSVVVSAKGEVVQRRMGRVSPADLSQWARLA